MNDGSLWMNINRQKTGSLCEIPANLGEEVPPFGGLLGLLDYFRSRTYTGRVKSGFMRMPTFAHYNNKLIEVTDAIGIDRFTSHQVCHTFGMTCINSCVASGKA